MWMTRKAKKRVPKPDRPTLSTRTSIELRAKLDAAAAKSGRSIAQETEYQLERAFALPAIEDLAASLRKIMVDQSKIIGTLAEDVHETREVAKQFLELARLRGQGDATIEHLISKLR
jgi:hypothetical protein